MNRVLIAESGSGYGGSAKYLASLLPLIDRDKFHMEFVAYGRGPFIHEIETIGEQLNYQPSWRFPWWESDRAKSAGEGRLGRILSLGRYIFLSFVELALMVPVIVVWLKRHKIELVHLNNEILSHLPLLIAARAAGCQTICHFHGWRNLTNTEKWASRLVDKFIAVTQSGADFYSWQLKGKGVVGIPNGLALEEKEEKSQSNIRYDTRKKLGLNENEFLAILIGRLIPLKGHSVFFQAIAKASKRKSGMRGLVVGNDPSTNGQYQEKLKSELKALGIESRITFLPWQDHMGPIYEASDVVVQPSIEAESFGYVALEGMAASKPVVASKIGGLIDVIRDGETGFLVAPGNSEELSNAVIRIADNPEFGSELGKNGRERVKNVFTMTHNAKRVQEIYGQLLNRSKILIAESGSGYGGTAKYLTNLLSSVDQKTFSIQVAAYGEGPFIQEIERKGWTVYHRRSWRYPWAEKDEAWGHAIDKNRFFSIAYLITAGIGFFQFLLLVPLIFLWLERKKIRIVHLNNGIRSHLPLLIAASFVGCRIICHFHGWRSFTRTELWLSPFVDQFVAISEAGKQFLVSQIPNQNVVAISNGLSTDVPLGNLSDRELLKIPKSAKVISIIGRLVKWKGQEIYLEALSKIVKKGFDVVGIVLGHDPTPNQEYLAKLRVLTEKLEISSRVHFMPWQDDVRQIYSVSDILIHASTDPEPFGLVILEAMFACKPVIATRGGGVSDLIIHDESGYLVKPNDPSELALAMERLISDEQYARDLAREGQKRAHTYFTIERNAKEIADVYHRLFRDSTSSRTISSLAKRNLSHGFKKTMFHTGILAIARKAVSSKIPILMYHRVAVGQDPFFPAVSIKTFKNQIAYIKKNYNLISLDEVVDFWKTGKEVSPNSLAVTFDDCDARNWLLISPILKEYDVPVTIFLTAGHKEVCDFTWTDLLRWWFKLTQLERYEFRLNGYQSKWNFSNVNDRLNAISEFSRKLKSMDNAQRKMILEKLEKDLRINHSDLPHASLLTWNQVKAISQSRVKIGAHTISHPILNQMTLANARYEIFESKKRLEEILSHKIKHFAYPNGELGDFTVEHEKLVAQAGFESASSTILGLNDSRTNRYALRRMYAAEESLAYFASRLVGMGG